MGTVGALGGAGEEGASDGWILDKPSTHGAQVRFFSSWQSLRPRTEVSPCLQQLNGGDIGLFGSHCSPLSVISVTQDAFIFSLPIPIWGVLTRSEYVSAERTEAGSGSIDTGVGSGTTSHSGRDAPSGTNPQEKLAIPAPPHHSFFLPLNT